MVTKLQAQMASLWHSSKFQVCWNVVKDDTMRVFQHFHVHSMFGNNLNATFVAHILKKVAACDGKDFRPISLVDSINKILAKDLAMCWGRLCLNHKNDFI